jgi:hypothetical protein
MKPKLKSMKQQRLDGELGLIIDEFGRAMWNANREYVTSTPSCHHETSIRFTPSMWGAWHKYVEFCIRNPE